MAKNNIINACFNGNITSSYLLNEYQDSNVEKILIIGEDKEGNIYIGWTSNLSDVEAAGYGNVLIDLAISKIRDE